MPKSAVKLQSRPVEPALLLLMRIIPLVTIASHGFWLAHPQFQQRQFFPLPVADESLVSRFFVHPKVGLPSEVRRE